MIGAGFCRCLLLRVGNSGVFCVADMEVGCEPGYITLVWTDDGALADTSLFRLGTCLPTSFSSRESVFTVDVNDCNFSRLVRVKLLMVVPADVVACVCHRLPVMSLSIPTSWFICPWVSPR